MSCYPLAFALGRGNGRQGLEVVCENKCYKGFPGAPSLACSLDPQRRPDEASRAEPPGLQQQRRRFHFSWAPRNFGIVFLGLPLGLGVVQQEGDPRVHGGGKGVAVKWLEQCTVAVQRQCVSEFGVKSVPPRLLTSSPRCTRRPHSRLLAAHPAVRALAQQPPTCPGKGVAAPC